MDGNNNCGGEISQFYAEKCIFITGATGFCGKVLLHKLLDSCPMVEKIYVLIRPKRGEMPQARLTNLFNGPMFNRLKEENPSIIKKVLAINGDISLPGLGMSSEDINTVIENVSVIFHSAATVRFDEELCKAVTMNVVGTRSIIDLAQKMRTLVAFVHVSTAYAHCGYHSKIEEKFYPVNDNPEEIIEKCKNGDVADEEAKKLVGDNPNTYSYTKALAEQLLLEKAQGLPLTIVRPSIVVAAWQYPLKGWVDNFNGPTGMIAGGGTGVLRTLLAKRELVADLIPVDVTINVMIVAAWKIAKGLQCGRRPIRHSHCECNKLSRALTPPIYQVTSGSVNPITWGQLEDWGLVAIRKYPMASMMWYPGGSFKENALHDRICRWLFHYAPAYLMDGALTILRKPTFMRKLTNRMTTSIGALQFFLLKEWSWSSTNLNSLQGALVNTDEKSLETFNFDIRPLDWKNFIEHYVLGTRHYALKDHPDTMDYSRKKLKLFCLLHYVIQLGFLFFVVYTLALSFY